VIDRKPDGTVYVRSPHPLGEYPERMTDPLDYWAFHASYRTFLAERESRRGWRNVTYAEAQFLARRIGQALLNRGLSVERPVVILSGNDIEHALLGLGAMYAGIPYAPISTAYSLVSTGFSKLRYIFELLTPGLVFASDGKQYRKAIEAVVPAGTEVVVTTNPPEGATLYSSLVDTPLEPSLQAANSYVTADTVFKILFTSGSTGTPKGVINTHRMWGSNQEMARGYFAFLADEPPVMVDWLPWNHTFGGNADVGLVLYNGGSLYIDHGRPAPGMFEETVRTLRRIAPTVHWNVPKGFEALIPYLRNEPEFAKHFFSRLKLLFYAGAGLSQQVWNDLAEISLATCGERILMLTGLGSTETAPHALFGLSTSDRPGLVGVPAPGVELKLVPATGGKLEARLRGPNITPGYWRRPDLTKAAFDEEGFYRLGDALRFADESEPAKGFVFDGRIGEDFKLASGTWVSVGPLRAKFVAHCAPYVQDVAIAGQDRDYIGALIFPNVDACCGRDVRSMFTELLASFARTSTGNSNRIAAAVILDTPPSLDTHEITDKGSLNQRAVLDNRKALVEELYSPSGSAIVIIC
jgi:feruloyl-CoA synthase